MPSGPALLRAVIVEDDSASRLMLRGILQNLGIDVVAETAQGAEGMDLCTRHQPELLCLDIGLPDVDGAELLVRMRGQHPGIRTVMVTGSAQREKVRECLAAGAVGYIVKPFAASTVRSTLQRLFPHLAPSA